MVDAGKVSSDASTIREILSKYSTSIGDISSANWMGISCKNAISKAEAFVSEYQGIVTQMQNYSSAVSEYEKYKNLKGQIRSTESQRANARDEDKASFDDALNNMRQDLNIYKGNINRYLSSASSPSLDATPLGVTSGLGGSQNTGDNGTISLGKDAITLHSVASSEEHDRRVALLGGECGSEEEQDSKMTTIEVPYWNGSEVSHMNLTVNQKLVDNFSNVFQKLADAKFTVLPECTGAYDYNHAPRPSGKPSDHTLGSVVDINWDHNWDTGDNSSYAVRGNEEVIEIFASEGFYWGGDWDKPDDMHFSYTGF